MVHKKRKPRKSVPKPQRTPSPVVKEKSVDKPNPESPIPEEAKTPPKVPTPKPSKQSTPEAETPRTSLEQCPPEKSPKPVESKSPPRPPAPQPGSQTPSDGNSTQANMQRRRPIQCFNCQRWGHTSHVCKSETRCVKCSGLHRAKDCKKSPDEPPKCANCHLGHTASYRGCKEAPKSKRSRRPRRRQIIEHPAVPRCYRSVLCDSLVACYLDQADFLPVVFRAQVSCEIMKRSGNKDPEGNPMKFPRPTFAGRYESDEERAPERSQPIIRQDLPCATSPSTSQMDPPTLTPHPINTQQALPVDRMPPDPTNQG